MKGKYIFVFADGSIMTDLNGYKTLAQAKGYAKSWNRTAPKRRRIVKVLSK